MRVLVLAALATAGAILAVVVAAPSAGTPEPSAAATPATSTETEPTASLPPEPPPPAPTPAPPPATSGGESPVALTDRSTRLIREGRYEEALPIAEQALAELDGSGEIYEAYANYNVGKSLIELGRCEEGLPYLDRSEQIQGRRKEIDRDRKACEKSG